LIAALEDRLGRADIRAPGLHLITSKEARNVTFYRRNGFVKEVERPLSTVATVAARLLFMGKRL
jgi:hypothetical protein